MRLLLSHLNRRAFNGNGIDQSNIDYHTLRKPPNHALRLPGRLLRGRTHQVIAMSVCGGAASPARS